jgi:transcriptional regulator with XRE-family HTH domain
VEHSDDIPGSPDEVPGRHVTINQVIAYNLARWRKLAGLTQDQLGERLGGWSNATVSAAERSWDGKRVRQFDADDLVALALALGIPLAALFLPPDDDGAGVRYLFHAHEHGADCSGMADLFWLLLPESQADEGLDEPWRKAFAAAVSRYMDPERGGELMAYLEEMTSAERRAVRL